MSGFPFPFGARIGGTLAGYGEKRTRAQTLSEHTSALTELKQGLEHSANFHIPNVASRKARLHPVPRPLESCSPVSVGELKPDTVHQRKVLRGRLITEAIKMQSVQSVLEDKACDVVTVHIYNVPSLPALTTTMADLRQAQAMFPEGQHLAVIEPFYKLMMDGTHGVRVDNPAEVLFLDGDGQAIRSAAYMDPALAATPVQDGRRVPKPRRPNKSKKSSKRPGTKKR